NAWPGARLARASDSAPACVREALGGVSVVIASLRSEIGSDAFASRQAGQSPASVSGRISAPQRGQRGAGEWGTSRMPASYVGLQHVSAKVTAANRGRV